jgi:cytidine deaminase
MKQEDIIKKLKDMAVKAKDQAYAPYSNHPVGCALLTEDGRFISGNNVENVCNGASFCAEVNAVGNAIGEKYSKLSWVYVYSKDGCAPCGICRQVLSEFASDDLQIIIGSEQGTERIVSFKELMPFMYTEFEKQ